jgi:hypothetical protein
MSNHNGDGQPSELQEIAAAPDLRRWRMEIPNLADEGDLTPHEFRLLAHYIRRGLTYESIRETARICQMNKDTVTSARDSLVEKGWLEVMEKPEPERPNIRPGLLIRVIDRWAENFHYFDELKAARGPLSQKRAQMPLSGIRGQVPVRNQGTGTCPESGDIRSNTTRRTQQEEPTTTGAPPRTVPDPMPNVVADSTSYSPVAERLRSIRFRDDQIQNFITDQANQGRSPEDMLRAIECALKKARRRNVAIHKLPGYVGDGLRAGWAYDESNPDRRQSDRRSQHAESAERHGLLGKRKAA